MSLPFFSLSTAEGYRAAVVMLALPLLVTFFGELAAAVGPGYRFPAQAITAAVFYVIAVNLALSAMQKPGLGSRLASAFSLIVALILPLQLHAILS